MRIYGLDVKDRLRTLNHAKNFRYTYPRPMDRGYGAYDRYRATNDPLSTLKKEKERPSKRPFKLYFMKLLLYKL